MSADSITLVLHHADSVRVLRAALVGQLRVLQTTATYHEETGQVRVTKQDAVEASRHKRLGAEYRRRVGLCQQLVDQLPAEPTPKGE